jgi:hypothetical protein
MAPIGYTVTVEQYSVYIVNSGCHSIYEQFDKTVCIVHPSQISVHLCLSREKGRGSGPSEHSASFRVGSLTHGSCGAPPNTTSLPDWLPLS